MMGVTRDIRHALRVVIPAMNLAAAAAFAATTGWRTDGTGRNAFFSLAGSLAKYFLSGPIEVKICAGKAMNVTV